MFGPWNGMLGMPGYGGLLSPEDQAYLRNQGMMSLAGNLLAASGPSPVKQNFGSIAGKGILGMQQGQQQAMQGLLQNKLYGAKLGEIEREKQREQGLAGLLGQKGEQIGATPYDDEGNPMVTPGTGLLGGKTALPEFYAQMAGLGGDYTKLGMAGLKSLNPSASESPSAVREWEYLKKEFPNMNVDFPTYLNVKRQGYSLGEVAGVPTMVPRMQGMPTIPLSTLPQETAAKSQLSQAQKFGQERGEQIANRPQAELRVQTMTDNMMRLKSAVTDLMGDPGLPRVTGTIAGRTPNVTNTATGAQGKLNTIKNQVFVSALQAMREASKTGGAVGNVSDREGDRLENSMAALDQAQGTPDFQKQLEKISQQLDVSMERIGRAYRETYGTDPQVNTKGNPEIRKTIGGKTYIKRGSEWFTE